MGQVDDAELFLRRLFGNVPDDVRMNVWTLATKTSVWFSRSDIRSVAESVAGKQNKYVGVSYIPQSVASEKQPTERTKIADAAGLVGLWADLDYGVAGHKAGHSLPPDEDSALSLVEEFPVQPSIVVHSGNGLQLWWLFREPMEITDAESRDLASKLALDWTNTLRAVCQQRGWDLDSTQDLSRILRIPGTVNSKPNAPVRDVKILSLTDRVFTETDFAIHRLNGNHKPAKKLVAGTKVVAKSDIAVDKDAQVPSEGMAQLSMRDPRFLQTFSRNRTDDALKDKSNSGYDFALAIAAARAGWNEQQIVNLIIASRRACNVDLSTENPDYYGRTARRAKEKVAEAEGFTEDEFDQLRNDSALALESLSKAFGIHIEGIVRYVSSPPNQYGLKTEFGSVSLGGIEGLIEQRKFRNTLADLTKVMIPVFKAERWEKVAQLMLATAADEDAGGDELEMHKEWLADYLTERKPTEKTKDAAKSHFPLIRKDGLYIFADNLVAWLDQHGRGKFNQKSIGAILRKLGYERVILGMGGSTRSVWKISSEGHPDGE